MTDQLTCDYCGDKMSPGTSGLPKRFCSPQHRGAFYRHGPRTTETRACVRKACDVVIPIDARVDKVYCGSSCRYQDWKEAS